MSNEDKFDVRELAERRVANEYYIAVARVLTVLLMSTIGISLTRLIAGPPSTGNGVVGILMLLELFTAIAATTCVIAEFGEPIITYNMSYELMVENSKRKNR